MSIFDKLFGREPNMDTHAANIAEDEAAVAETVARDHVVELARPFIDRPALSSAGLRNGMWVMTGEGVGIITGCRLGGVSEVTLAKADGTTRMQLDADDKAVPHVVLGDVATIRQATADEIPASRRHPEVEKMAAMGYTGAAA